MFRVPGIIDGLNYEHMKNYKRIIRTTSDFVSSPSAL